jgi:hypothetical protein
MARRPRNGVVKQLSNLSIDEVSLVDRGANQHATIAISKRAPEVEESFEFEKKAAPKSDARKLAELGSFLAPGGIGGAVGAGVGAKHHKVGHAVGGGVGSAVGTSVGTAVGAAATKGKVTGAVAGGYLGSVVGGSKGTQVAEEHYATKKKGFKKALDEMDLDALFEKKEGGFWERQKQEQRDANEWVKQTGGPLGGYKERTRQIKAEPKYKEGQKKGYQALGLEAGGVGLGVHGAMRGSKPEMVAGGALWAGGVAHSVHGWKDHNTALRNAREKSLAKKNFTKALDEMNLDDLFDVSKKGSFGQGGEHAGVDSFSGSDPSGILKDSDKEKNVGPDGKIGGVEHIEGEDTPPKKAKKKGASSEVNPSELSGLGKSADFWTGIIEKVLEDGDQEFIEKHFPGGGGNPMDPSQSPFPGAQGPAMGATMQTPGVQPMGMGQPTAPPASAGGMPGAMGAPGAPTGGMPQQLPPDVVAYIQQLEQALQQAQGGSSEGDSDNSDASSNSDNSEKKNPFGKSGDFGMDTNDLFLQELAKSLDQEDNRELIGKAYEAVSKAEERAQAAEEIAKAERDLRLEREFIAKADEFNVPVSSKELGPVLKRLAESATVEDFQVIVKCLRGTSEQASLFSEVGKRGGGDNGSILDEVNARAQEFVGKALTPEQAVTQVFEMDPRAYDAYVAERRAARNSF